MLTDKEISDLINRIRDEIAGGAEGLDFEPQTHTYTYKGREMMPVSEVCKQFEESFDSDYWARRKAIEQGVSTKEVLRKWEDGSRRACEEGTGVHAYAQWHFHRHTGMEITDDEVLEVDRAISDGTLPADPRHCCVDRFWDYVAQINRGDFRLYPVAAENRIVNPELGYAGTFDLLCLCVKPDGDYGLIIFDYKTNGNLFNIFRHRDGRLTRMLAPIECVVACNAALYTCQLNLYQLGLQRVTSVPIVARRLVWVEPDGVDAIHRNSTEGYLTAHRRRTAAGKNSKWCYFPNYAHDIDALKRIYRFTCAKPEGSAEPGIFATLSLPDLSGALNAHLSQNQPR